MGGYYDVYVFIGIAVGIGISIGFALLVFKMGGIRIRYIEDGEQLPAYQLMEHQDDGILPVSPPSYSPFPSPPPPYTVLDTSEYQDDSFHLINLST